MEAARIQPETLNKASVIFSILMILVMFIVLSSGYVFGQNPNEVGLTDIAGAYGVDNQRPSSEIKVYQNYPNPFSSSTTIKFETAAQSNLKVVIYDQNGAFVKAYLYDNIAPGMHEVKVDGSEFSAGDYTYRFVSGNYSQSYKMNLVK